MTLGQATQEGSLGHSSSASHGRAALLGLAVQAIGALAVWVVVDDQTGRTWSNSDFEEWLRISIATAAMLAVLGGGLTRRGATGVAVLMGCLLATALGCAVFVGYAVMNSA
jgi:peptidoglycan biosynthesis protein MviN/MurJ (putative lipid II flippase)